MIIIYILKLSNGTYYTGMTNNIERRFFEHSSGKSRSTKNHLPFSFIYSTSRPSYQLARKVEKYIKATGAVKFLLQMKFGKIKEGDFY